MCGLPKIKVHLLVMAIAIYVGKMERQMSFLSCWLIGHCLTENTKILPCPVFSPQNSQFVITRLLAVDSFQCVFVVDIVIVMHGIH